MTFQASQYHERLKALAALGKPCEITYLDQEGNVVTTNTHILDLRMVKEAEYLFGKNNVTIRLDKLIAVNGIPMEPKEKSA